MKNVTKYIYNQVAAKQLTLDEAKTMLKELQDLEPTQGNEVAGATKVAQAVSSETAIIGMACKFPKADNPDEFWNIIINKIDCIDKFPPERAKECLDLANASLMAWMIGGNPQKHEAEGGAVYVKKGYLQEIDKFDAAFFKISPKEAMHMDPPQRIFLETAYEAMEDAGYGGQNLYGAKVGVFVGKDHTHPTLYREVSKPDEMQLAGSWTGVLASRISYIYNFRGPSMVIDTACSSGLVALHEACRALNNKECDTAIAGGVQIQLFTDIKSERSMELDLMEARDEQVRTFDKNASGTVLGEGAAALILKPLEKAIADRDHIYAVIKGSAINNDGASGGITAPNAEAQKDVIIKAWKEAKINPETISYIEAHGTGTGLGDPIEIKGISSAFAEFTTKKQFCGVGSVKTNLGHLVAASGIASVIKVVLAFQKNVLPPSINFNAPNPFINFENSPVYVNVRPRKWIATEGLPRRAGVSSFGLSGTNSHVILEEPPAESSKTIPAQTQLEILTIAARNKSVLQELLKRYHRFLAQNPAADLGDICYTANTGRGHYTFRIAFVVADLDDLKQKIATLNSTDLEAPLEPGIYVGSYKMVPAHGAQTSARANGYAETELTENERKQLNSSAVLTLKEFLAAGADGSRESAAELCQAYVKGADIAWNELYRDRGYHKLSLPTYPLERIRYWAEPNTSDIDEEEIGAHPLFHKLLSSSLASYYGFTWLPAKLQPDAPPAGNGRILVFKDKKGIADLIIQGLKATGRDLIEVETGAGYAQITENKYQISGEAGDYQKLVAALHDQKIIQILHLMSITTETGPEETLTALEAKQAGGLYSLFYLSRAMTESNFQDRIDLVLIADHVNEVTKEEEWLNPTSAAFFGLGKVVVFENAKLQCRAIDIDQHTAPGKIIAEILTPGSAYQVAYRRGQRFIEEFQAIEFPKKPGEAIKNSAPIREGGCYIITGGTGGIGLEIGKRLALAGKAKVKLAFVNRTAMPGREIWNEILSRGEDQKLCAKITAIREMEQAGAEVLTFSADITSESSLKPVLDELRQKFGQINGIIHAAGAAGFEFMTGKDFRNFKNVTSPKIEGTWLLDKLTDADDLDFFILFSSVVTLTGGAGQSDYTAANSYLDSFAAYRNKQGKRTISINWPVWEGVGMANLNPETYENMIFKTVSPAKALNTFEEILTAVSGADYSRVKYSPVNLSRVIYGELNYKMFAAISDYLPFKLSERISAAVKKQTAQFTKSKAVSKERIFQKARVTGLSSQDEEQTAYILAQIWARVLALDEIDINLSIYEQGGDSILASQLLREIDGVYPKILKIADIFSYPTVSQLASYIDSIYQLSGSQKPGAPTRAMDAVSENSTTPASDKLAAALPDSSSETTAVASPSQVNPFYNLKNYQLFEVDQAGTKVLQIKLQNEITCYLSHALPLCVVLAHPNLIPWYYEHFVDIYSVTDENDFLKVDFLEYRAAYKEMLYEVYLGYNLLKKESDIIQFIVDKIDLGYYVIIHVDEYYLPVKALYHKEHYVHHSIIYGYHHENKELLAIGFNAEQIFTRITFDFDTFTEAYEQGKYHYQQSAPWAENNAVELLKLKDYHEEYPFDIKRFLGKLDGYLSGRGDDTVIFSYNFKPNQDKIAYGMNVYQQIVKHLEHFLEGRFTMDYRAIHLLTEHKKSIYSRLEFILKRYRITGTLENMVREYAGIVGDVESLRRKFMGQHYALASNQLDKNLAFIIIKESLKNINLIREKEEKILTAIYQQMRQEL